MSDIPKAYKVKTKRLSGTHFPRLLKKALSSYKEIRRKTKRRPYVRSAYFKKDKIFLANADKRKKTSRCRYPKNIRIN